MAFLEILADEQAEIINGGYHSKYKCYTPAPPMKHCYNPCLPGGWGMGGPITKTTTTVEAVALNIATATAGGAGSVAMAGNQSANIGINIGAC